MIIKSAFRDYYDFVANQYGGGDPKIVYVRKRIKDHYDAKSGGHGLAVQVRRWTFPNLYNLANCYSEDNKPIRCAYLIVAAKPYLLCRERITGTLGLDGYKITDLAVKDKDKPSWRRTDWSFLGRESPILVDLSRQVGAPVFVVDGDTGTWRSGGDVIYVNELCPILKDVGMPALISPQQMYQELAYFMGNTMHPSPDVKPPVEVSNRDKILAAGFDLKQSFRHRV